MARWVKCLPRIRMQVKFFKTFIKPGMVECIGNLCAPIVRWEVETGDSVEAGGPTRLASTMMNNRPYLGQRRKRGYRSLSYDSRSHAMIRMCPCLPPKHTHIHTEAHTQTLGRGLLSLLTYPEMLPLLDFRLLCLSKSI